MLEAKCGDDPLTPALAEGPIKLYLPVHFL